MGLAFNRNSRESNKAPSCCFPETQHQNQKRAKDGESPQTKRQKDLGCLPFPAKSPKKNGGTITRSEAPPPPPPKPPKPPLPPPPSLGRRPRALAPSLRSRGFAAPEEGYLRTARTEARTEAGGGRVPLAQDGAAVCREDRGRCELEKRGGRQVRQGNKDLQG